MSDLYCRYCGAQIEQGAIFCGKCGKQINDDGIETYVDEYRDGDVYDLRYCNPVTTEQFDELKRRYREHKKTYESAHINLLGVSFQDQKKVRQFVAGLLMYCFFILSMLVYFHYPDSLLGKIGGSIANDWSDFGLTELIYIIGAIWAIIAFIAVPIMFIRSLLICRNHSAVTILDETLYQETSTTTTYYGSQKLYESTEETLTNQYILRFIKADGHIGMVTAKTFGKEEICDGDEIFFSPILSSKLFHVHNNAAHYLFWMMVPVYVQIILGLIGQVI